MSRRVAVVSGGRSSEHEVSLASARSVVTGLTARGFEVIAVEIDRAGAWALARPSGNELEPREVERTAVVAEATGLARLPGRSIAAALAGADVVFPVLHGPHGEDGTVQGLLELAGVPYVGAGVAASALCMDKDLFKSVLRDNGIPVPANVTLRPGETARNPYRFPVFVKPARLGSSVGITKAHDEAELEQAVSLAFEHDEKVLIEELVIGTEVEVGVLGNHEPVVSLPGEIVVTHKDWYDYAAKYDEGEMQLVIPPRLPAEQVERVRELALRAFVASECEGMARVDMFVRQDGEVLVNELNTIPGFTATSVYAKLFEASGIAYGELLERLVDLAVERHERRARLRF